MPTNLKKMVRARMAETGERYTAALRHVRSQAESISATLIGGLGPTVKAEVSPTGVTFSPVLGRHETGGSKIPRVH